jgi:hypothetical protein
VIELFFRIREIGEKTFPFRVPKESLDEYDFIELLAERAANVYFFGHGGYLCDPPWPLMFDFFEANGELIGTADIYPEDGGMPPTFGMVVK